MNVRTRLVSGFVLMALFVLALFGWVAYRTVIESNHGHEVALLVDLAQDQEIKLKQRLEQGATSNQLLSQLDFTQTKNSALILLDQQYRFLGSGSDVDLFDIRLDQFPYQRIFSQKGLSGSLESQQRHYSWATRPLQEGNLHLVILHQEESSQPDYSKTLGQRLLVTAFVIIWLAFWIALIFSKRIIQQLDQQNSALLHLALYDDLTDLPNRRSLNDHLQHLDENTHYALLIIDLNNLRDINDTLGHSSGDELIKVAAERILLAIDKTRSHCDIVARLGGDAFAVLCEVTNARQGEEIAREILYQISLPIHIDNMDIVTHASIGCAHYPQDADSAESLLKRAEVSMFHAKQVSINFQSYNNEIDPFSKQRLELMSSLREAIEEGQLLTYFQPKINLSNMHTTGVEVLVRWQHPEKGIIPPDQFIPLAETCDLIDKLTHYVLNEALRQCHYWNKEGKYISVAVNLSARNLLDANLVSQVEGLLQKWQVPAKQLKLEVTESVIMSDPEVALHTLNQLHKIGTPLSVDDYGTGYSSLSYIKLLPISEIKIDRTFVSDMLTNQEDEVIVNSTIELAHKLGLCVVAEGVEDQATLQRLSELQCNQAQGFHMSRPLPVDELNEWLHQSEWPVLPRS